MLPQMLAEAPVAEAAPPSDALVVAEVGISDWMEVFLGTTERNLIGAGRQQLFAPEESVATGVAGSFVNLKTGQRRPAGHFECPSVGELTRRVENLPEECGGDGAGFVIGITVVDDVDIGVMQATLRTEDCAMVQIASNFNCLEVASQGHRPNCGELVEGYASDSTQGPAASFGVPAACLLRAHYPFHSHDTDPSTWGQTSIEQVELLSDVRNFFGSCINGKSAFHGDEDSLSVEQIDAAANAIKIGVHSDAQIVFGRGRRGMLNVVAEPRPLVDQAVTASVNWYGAGGGVSKSQLLSLTRAALRACYEGTYLAAIARGRRLLLLTLVGGGCFGNPEDMILEEIARAHARWASHPASALQEVRLCLYPRQAAVRVDAILKDILALQTGTDLTGRDVQMSDGRPGRCTAS